MKPSRSVCPAWLLRTGWGRPAENWKALPQLSANDPAAPCVTWRTTFCPSAGFDGLAMVRFPAMVTRKSLPREASIAIVGASVRLTTAGATAACSTVVAATANTPLARRARALPPPAASAGDPPARKAPPAVPAAAAPTAPLKTFRRLSAVRRPVPSVPPVPLGSGPAASGRGTGEWRDMIGSFSGPDAARPATRRLSGQSGSHVIPRPIIRTRLSRRHQSQSRPQYPGNHAHPNPAMRLPDAVSLPRRFPWAFSGRRPPAEVAAWPVLRPERARIDGLRGNRPGLAGSLPGLPRQARGAVHGDARTRKGRLLVRGRTRAVPRAAHATTAWRRARLLPRL